MGEQRGKPVKIVHKQQLSCAPRPQEHVFLYLHRHIVRRTPQNLWVFQSKLSFFPRQLKHEAGWPKALALRGRNGEQTNKTRGCDGSRDRPLNHRGTSGRRNNNYNNNNYNNAQETGMSKLHVTSGTKTCNRLKSILLFPCDKWNTEYRSHYTSIQNQDTTKHPFQRPNTWTRRGNQNPTHPLVFFLLSFTVDGGLWVSQTWQELSWGRGRTRLSPLRSSRPTFSPRIR